MGIELHLFPIVAQCPQQVAHLVGDQVGLFGQGVQVLVHVGQPGKALLYLPHQVDGPKRRAHVPFQSQDRFFDALDEVLGVGEATTFRFQGLVLARLQVGAVDLLNLVGEEVGALSKIAGVCAQVLEFPPHVAQAGHFLR